MDGSSFDRLVRLTAEDASRRGVLKSALASAALGLGAISLLGVSDADAKKKKKKRCKKAGKACKNNKQCCPGKTKRFCDVAQDDSGGNEVCCGREGAKCGGEDELGNAIAPKCCIGEAGETPQFACSSQTATPGTCQLVPDET
jgi:hypothetical protein